ncbi:MAG: hypothetical protein E7610_02365 [Ruminococcaceae bacterium]|nr:hypothetical protein [Oscillospiraceae bacterium]
MGKFLGLQTNVQVGGNGEDQKLEQDDRQVFAFAGEKGGIDQTG